MIKVGTLAKIRRLYFRDKQSIKEICRQTGMSRNTVRSWLRDPEMVEPKYPVRVVVSKPRTPGLSWLAPPQLCRRSAVLTAVRLSPVCLRASSFYMNH